MPRPRRAVAWIALAVAVVVAAALGLWPARPVRVDVVTPERIAMVDTVVSSGVVRAPRRTTLGVERVGTVVSVAVEKGARVSEGQLLVQLDDRSARAALEEARARLAGEQAQLRRLRATSAEVALATQAAARAELARAEEELERQTRLVAAGAAATQARDQAVRTLEVAEARLRGAELAVRAASGRGDDVRVAIAGQERAAASVEAAEAALAQTRVLAPADGVVLERFVEPGAVVQPGTPMLELMRSEPPELVVTPEEANLASLRVGQRALASAEPFPDRRFAAVVDRIAPAVDEARGTVEVVLRVPDPPDYLRPGMTVSVEIELAREPNALALPAMAVEGLGEGAPRVFVDVDGVARRRSIRVGIRDAERVSVLEGLGDGDRVLVRPARPLEDGDRIRVRRSRG